MERTERHRRNLLSWILLSIAVCVILWQGRVLSQAQRLRREAEAAGNEQRLRAELIVLSSPYAIIMCDDNQKIVVTNLAAEFMFGWSHDELLGQDITVLIPDNFREKHKQASEKAEIAARENPGNWLVNKVLKAEGLHRNGKRMPLELNIRAIKVGKRIEFIAMIKDVEAGLPLNEPIPLPKIEERIPLTAK